MSSRFFTKSVMKPMNLISASGQEFRKFLDSFDHVFTDCDGVLWMMEALPGVSDFVKLMKLYGKSVHYISNNSLRSKENYEEQFRNAGIENGYENLTIPSVAIADYLKSINFNKQVYCVSCPEARKTLEAKGFRCKHGPDEAPEDMSDFRQYLVDDLEIGAVMFDSDYKVNMAKMYRAFTYLKRPEVIVIDGPTDKFVPYGDGSVGLGLPVFTNALTEIMNRVPIIMGKPSKSYGEFAMKRAGISDPSSVLFIGDMIEQDIVLGKNVGFKTLLVLSHSTEEQMLKHDIKPDFYAPSLGSLVPLLKKHVYFN